MYPAVRRVDRHIALQPEGCSRVRYDLALFRMDQPDARGIYAMGTYGLPCTDEKAIHRHADSCPFHDGCMLHLYLHRSGRVRLQSDSLADDRRGSIGSPTGMLPVLEEEECTVMCARPGIPKTGELSFPDLG